MSAVVTVATIAGGLVAGWWLGGKLCQLYTRRRQHRDGLTPDEVAAIARQVRDELRLEAIADTLREDPFPIDSPEHMAHTWQCWDIDVHPARLAEAEKAEPC